MARIALVATPETITFDDLLGKLNLLPDDQPADTALVSAALTADLAPQSAYEKVIVANLVSIEIERQRLDRWIAELVRDGTWWVTKSDLRRKRVADDDLNAYAAEWQRGGGPGLTAAIQEHGINISQAVAQARINRAAEIRQFESNMRMCENRRRSLFRDLKMLRDDRRPAIPEAEVVI